MPGPRIVAKEDILELKPGTTLALAEGAIITPLAADLIAERGIRVVWERRGGLRIAVASDHAGYAMKGELKRFLRELDHMAVDLGTHDESPVDYPDFALAAALAVARGECDLAIVLDGAGIGSAIAANKVPGIRAAMCYDEATARNSREHNAANVLTLGARMIDSERMRSIVAAWLDARPRGNRHARRVRKIQEIEERYLKGGPPDRYA